MPRRQDIETILILGSGPIVIGQACEFDYSGTQACKALKEDGFRIVLINSNPATIMTDPEVAHRTYIEPITPEMVTMVIKKERPDAILPTLGGQTALNTAMILADQGVLEEYGVEMIGANRNAIQKAEGRHEFREAMQNIGLDMPHSRLAYGMDEALQAKAVEFDPIVKSGRTHLMDAMPVRMEQSLSGWQAQICQQIKTLNAHQPAIQTLALGGTAVGTGINAHPDFSFSFNQALTELTGIPFQPADNFFALIASVFEERDDRPAVHLQ